MPHKKNTPVIGRPFPLKRHEYSATLVFQSTASFAAWKEIFENTLQKHEFDFPGTLIQCRYPERTP